MARYYSFDNKIIGNVTLQIDEYLDELHHDSIHHYLAALHHNVYNDRYL